MSQRHLSAQSSIREIRKPEISHPQLIVLLQPPPHDARPRMREKNLRPRCTTLVPMFPPPPMPPPPSSFLSSTHFLFVPSSPLRAPIKTGAPAAQNLNRPKSGPTAGNPPTCLSEGGGRRRRGKEGDCSTFLKGSRRGLGWAGGPMEKAGEGRWTNFFQFMEFMLGCRVCSVLALYKNDKNNKFFYPRPKRGNMFQTRRSVKERNLSFHV